MKTIALAFALLAPIAAQAGDVWLNINAVSHHFNTEHKFNQNNVGVGVEYQHGDYLAMAGRYNNSMGYPSRYALAGWLPLQYGPVRLGALAGALDGYPAINGGKVGPAAALLAQIAGDRVGVNLMLLPPFKGAPLTAGLQFRIKF